MSRGLSIQGLCVADNTGEMGVDDVTLDVAFGRVTALVGESGSGKTVTSLAAMDLLPSGLERVAGRVVFDDEVQDAAGLRSLRGRDLVMVFQEPMTALNPVMRIGQQLLESRRGPSGSRSADRAWCRDALDEVGIPDAARVVAAYPHELSGGMRQRVLIAMALAAQPRVVLADEPTTALDAVNRADVLDRIASTARHGAAVMLVTHDLQSVRRWAHDVVVMCRGRVMEAGPAADVFAAPMHPYTRGLLACVPDAASSGRLVELESIMSPEELARPIDTLDGPQVPWWHGVGAVWGLRRVSTAHAVACRIKEP